MPTNNVKHNMLQTAKRIAHIKFRTEEDREEIINKTLQKHPEFVEPEFRDCVDGFLEKEREKEESIGRKEAERLESGELE